MPNAFWESLSNMKPDAFEKFNKTTSTKHSDQPCTQM